MQKSSMLFLLIISSVALIGLYQSLFPLPAQTVFTRFFALSSYLLLCVSLIIGPMIVLRPASFGPLAEPRRAIGIACFVFALLHVGMIVALRYDWSLAPLLFGIDPLISVPATVILLALALTSSDYAQKMLGPKMWKNVQRFNYLAFILVTIHFILKANGLFASMSGTVFLNLAEAALLALGLITIGLQIAGFAVRRERMADAAKKNQKDKSTQPESASAN